MAKRKCSDGRGELDNNIMGSNFCRTDQGNGPDSQADAGVHRTKQRREDLETEFAS